MNFTANATITYTPIIGV